MATVRGGDRRSFLKGAAAVAAAVPICGYRIAGTAMAQDALPGSGAASPVWSELGRLTVAAQKQGLSVPRMSLGPESLSDDYSSTMPAIVDFIDSLDGAIATAPVEKADAAEDLKDEASVLLGKVLAAEKMPREPLDEPTAPGAAPTVKAPAFETVAEGYRDLFRNCVIRSDKSSEVKWYTDKLIDPARRERYQKIEDEICVPWYFVGIIHGMECAFDFNKHLHNGDPLRYRTVQIPKGRPQTWNPPTDWHSSAVDALRYDKFADLTDWDLARMLYRWEAYNGWRSRLLYKINTPYLWSFSNHYTKGKFVADNVWDGNAVSKQCGAAVMLKAIVESGAIGQPV
jgi:lysozyme family protein